MASVARTAASKAHSMTVGQTILFGSSVVAASLGGFYWNLRRMQNKKAERGDLPHYEYLLAHVASRGLANPVPGAAELPLSRHGRSGNSIPAPLREHRSGHSTVANYQPSSTSSEIRARFEQPTPQRAKELGSSIVYTKSPDYAKSYEKTAKGKAKLTEGMPSLASEGEVPEVMGVSS
ncbi:hypothetical protein DXG01_008208 [Tephrocybe rancida]|nr:hypothetical protein DXG01_008208 [Tephrocybe rancida]